MRVITMLVTATATRVRPRLSPTEKMDPARWRRPGASGSGYVLLIASPNPVSKLHPLPDWSSRVQGVGGAWRQFCVAGRHGTYAGRPQVREMETRTIRISLAVVVVAALVIFGLVKLFGGGDNSNDNGKPQGLSESELISKASSFGHPA